MAPGDHKLDLVCSMLELLAHCLTPLVGTIYLCVQPPTVAVPTRNADGFAADKEAGSNENVVIERPFPGGIDVVRLPNGADARDSDAESIYGIPTSPDCPIDHRLAE